MSLRVVFEEPAFPEMFGEGTFHHIRADRDDVGATMLIEGMTSGAPSVAFVAKLEDGSFLMLEMSLAMLDAFLGACRGRLAYLQDLSERTKEEG